MGRRKQKKNQWLRQHTSDGFTKRALAQGYRSRAVYKLQEIDQRDRLISPGMRLLELGAAPGGWSQYAGKKVGHRGKVVAVDLLEMKPVENVILLRGDFTHSDIQSRIPDLLGGPVDLVLSDMAPNITGIKATDQARHLELLESALILSTRLLRLGGNMLLKAFEGSGLKSFRVECETRFQSVDARKPDASRSKSAEFYILAKGLRDLSS